MLELYIDTHNAPVETVSLGSWEKQTYGWVGTYQANLPERDAPYPYQGGGVWTPPKQPLSPLG